MSIQFFVKNDLIFIFPENALMLAVSVFQVPLKKTVFYVKISNALFEEKQQLNDQDFA